MLMQNTVIFNSKTIIDNHQDFIDDTLIAYEKFKKMYESEDSTWLYQKYNLFTFTSTSILYYDLYYELRNYIRGYLKDYRRLWIEAWMNVHDCDKIGSLGLHGHEGFAYHGYVSVDPKKTRTIFPKAEFEIVNKPGQIYLGPATTDYEHEVVVDEAWEGKRITLAFDISTEENRQLDNHLIPLV